MKWCVAVSATFIYCNSNFECVVFIYYQVNDAVTHQDVPVTAFESINRLILFNEFKYMYHLDMK